MREERGAYAILFVIITVVAFIMVAIAVDLGAARATVRNNRTYADLGMLAGGNFLPSNPQGACNEAWTYLIANGAIPVGTTSPCAGLPSSCPNSGNATTVTKTVGQSVYSFTYPVPVNDPNMFGQSRPAIDGTDPCERMALTVRSTVTTLFGGIVGSGSLSAPATAVVRSSNCAEDNTCNKVAVALLLLDPYACNTLTTQGNNVQVFVQAAPPPSPNPSNIPGGPGRITVDSNAKSTGNSCNGTTFAVAPNGSDPDRIEAFPFGNSPGVVGIYAIQLPDLTCTATNKACNPSQILPNTAIVDAHTALGAGVPSSLINRVTRAPFDHLFNCKSVYPTYNVGGGPALVIPPCVDTLPPYIDNLQTAIDGAATSQGPPPVFPTPTTIPNGYTNTISGGGCNAGNNDSYAAGNWWVNCPGGYTVANGKSASFACGNIVFQGAVTISGTLNVNTNCPAGRSTYNNPSCLTVVTGCVTDFSSKAAYMYIRNGDFQVSGTGTTANLTNTMMFLKNGTYGMKSGSPALNHFGPTEGPFKNLTVWTESGSQMDLKGVSGVGLQGVFFAPQANISYTGQGCNIQTQAQFISRTLSVGGNGCLNMVPNPSRIVLAHRSGSAHRRFPHPVIGVSR
jgi:hypothetical protein